MMVQILAVIWMEEDPKVQENIALQIMFGHLIDDFADHWNIKAERSLNFGRYIPEQTDEEFLDYALSSFDPTGELVGIHKSLIKKIRGDLKGWSDTAYQLLLSSMRRTIFGGRIFWNESLYNREARMHQLELVGLLHESEILRGAMNHMDLIFVSWSIKANMDMILPLANPQSMSESASGTLFYDALLGSLFLGPIVHSHNYLREDEMVHLIGPKQILADLKLVGTFIRFLPPERKRQLIKYFPAVLEAFRGPVSEIGLLRFYVEFLQDQQILPFLPISSDTLRRLRDLMKKEELF